MLTALLLLAAANACSIPSGELQRQGALPYATFDESPGRYGWRQLSTGGCVDEAVAALVAYASANMPRLSPAQRMELSFHAGQVLALAGREAESIAHFERAVGTEATAEWSAYVEATLAFLRHDLVGLQAARDRYASIDPESMRLRFIDGMVACPEEPYAKAVHCRL